MLKPNSKLVYDYVKANGAKNITASDIAEGTGLEAEVELEDGSHKKVKFITLTAEGEAFDPEAEDAE